MYKPIELAHFAFAEFERDLAGLTDDEARVRTLKADGTRMNAISWIVAHVAGHWLARPEHLEQFNFRSSDPTPPSLAQARAWFEEGREFTERWLPNANDELLTRVLQNNVEGETIGTGMMRATLHTWFHNGEINAIRQMLGHHEIFFLGDITQHLEWHVGGNVEDGFRPRELARFAFSEFERGLEGISDEEARTRVEKSDGTKMNAITWTIKHISVPWLFGYTLAADRPMPSGMRDYFGADADPTPPPLADALALFADARASMEAWLPRADEDLLSSKRDFGPLPDENIGTQLMRAVLHTWFHIGEINATRQLLGHAEIPYVGVLLGNLEWRGGAS